jgi:GDP-L-fucose synthase
VDYPVKEDEMWNGLPHPSYFGYGWMRRYTERLTEYVADQTNIKIALVRPTAVYGRRDNFDPVTCHVIPALIRKAVGIEAPFKVWGTGEEVRDFLHVTDLVRGCLLMVEKAANCDPINIGYGKTITIREVVQGILTAAEYENAKIEFDSTKPTNIPIRRVDTSKAKKLIGFEPKVSIKEGLADTVNWYIKSNAVHNRD